MREEVFFIDGDGNRISCESICSHIGLANAILQKDETLQNEFKESKKNDPVDFLISNKGYIKITNQLYYRKCIYSSLKVSEKQRKILSYYCEEGYSLDDADFKKYIERAQ